MFDIKTLDGTICLAEPTALKRLVSFAAAMPCYSAREVAKEHRKRMEAARNVAASAVPTTLTPSELQSALHPETIERRMAAKAVRAVSGKVGVVAVHGPIQQRLTSELMKAGGTSCDEISAQFDALLADPSISAIVMHVDSPGGGVYGVEELSDKIFAARDRKPLYSIADSMSCSAAYWLATSAQTVCCTPGGDVGSVGVYCLHIDESEMLKGLGVKVSWIHAGKYKVEGNSAEPLDDEARANLQASVDETYGKFIDALSRNRHDVSKADVRANFGQGRVVSAANALAAKMIDRVETYEGLMGKLTGSSGQGSASRAASVEMQRMRHAAREREMSFAGK